MIAVTEKDQNSFFIPRFRTSCMLDGLQPGVAETEDKMRIVVDTVHEDTRYVHIQDTAENSCQFVDHSVSRTFHIGINIH